MSRTLPDESLIREEKAKGEDRAHEQAQANAAVQAVLFSQESNSFEPLTNNAKPQAEIDMIKESKLFAPDDIFSSPEPAPPAGKGGGKNKNKAPDAVDDSYSTGVNSSVDMAVLSNDSDPEGDDFSITSHTLTSNGTLIDNLDGTFTYTPDSDFQGTDSFTYTVTDINGNSATATVDITVGTPPAPEPDPVNYLEALTFDDVNRWNYPGPESTTIEVTYYFLDEVPTYYHKSATENRKFTSFTEEQRNITREMLDMIDDYANITFREVFTIEEAQITYGYADLGARYAGWAYIPDGDDGIMDHSGDIWLNYRGQDLSEGSFYGMALLHETGHALGLAHPHDGTILNDSSQDHRGYTVMSYNADAYGGLEPITLMLYDIATLQMLYGANTTTAAGDTIYDLSTPDYYYASNISIWDAGGHDELDGSALSDNLILDLNEGSFSSVGLVNSLSIAYGAYIEDATGGSGDDFLTGNELDNTLSGEAGNDNLYGGEGTDSLFGGAGDDALYYDGQDVLDGGEGVDTLLVSLFEAVIDAGSNLISSIEIFNLDNAGSNTVNITLSDILDLSDNAALYVLGDDGVDNVTVSGGTYQESVSVEGVTYAQYSDGTSNLYVEETLLLVSV